MAIVVPMSHSHRWRSRSRNASKDFESYLAGDTPMLEDQQEDQVGNHSLLLTTREEHADDDHHEESTETNQDDDDDESDEEYDEEMIDDVHSSAWIVMPQGYVSPLAVNRVPTLEPPVLSRLKSMERRRATQSPN